MKSPVKKIDGICLAAILRDEEKFLDEWLLYHRLLGIDHFYLYDDSEALPLKIFLTPHAEYVTVIPWFATHENLNGRNRQTKAYFHAVTNFGKMFEWIALVDADEFIVLREHQTLHEFLTGFAHAGSVSFNWRVFGHNGYFRDPSGLITTALIRRMKKPSPHVKSISRIRAIVDIISVHYCELANGWERVDVNNRNKIGSIYDGVDEIAHINHYQCRSYTNWMNRVDRGAAHLDINSDISDELWRTNKQACLEKFVTTVALDKNEFIDTYMIKHSYNIVEKLALLKRRKGILNKKSTAEVKIRLSVEKQLHLLASIILANVNNAKSLGLFNGMTGVAVFLFYYARFSENKLYREAALTLINNVPDLIDQEGSIDYANGLAGIGCAIENLVQNGFFNEDTDEILHDIDELLHINLISAYLPGKDLYRGTSGLGKYFHTRVRNPFNKERYPLNKSFTAPLDTISSLLAASQDDFFDILGNLNFLSDKFAHNHSLETIERIKQEISKTESLLFNENKENCCYNNVMSFTYSLLAISETTQDISICERAVKILKKAEQRVPLFHQCGVEFSWASVIEWLIYEKLNSRFNDPAFKTKAIEQIKSIYENNAALLSAIKITNPESINITLWDGLAGRALALLLAVDERNPTWLDLFPVIAT